MESYPGSDAWWLRHTVRVTLQYKEFIGHIAYWRYSDMCGLEVLEIDPGDLVDQELIEHFVENDCEFKFNEDEGDFRFTLHAPDGERSRYFDADIDELGCYIVGVEIIDAAYCNPDTGEVVER